MRRRLDLASAGFEAAHSPMLVVGPDGIIVVASRGAATLLGIDHDELVGAALEKFFDPPSSVADCHTERRCRPSQVRQLRVRHSGGDVIPVEVQCSPFCRRDMSNMIRGSFHRPYQRLIRANPTIASCCLADIRQADA